MRWFLLVCLFYATGTSLAYENRSLKIISLAPNITELIFSLEAGRNLAGVAAGSDYPDEAQSLPVIANSGRINYEELIRIKPDIVFAWQEGANSAQIKRLQHLGFKVVNLRLNSLTDIPRSIRLVGDIMGKQAQAFRLTREFGGKLKQARPQSPTNRTVFIHIWDKPLISLNKNSLFGDVVEFCGGVNIFKNLPTIAPMVNIEAIIKADPDIILSSGASLDIWSKFGFLKAVKTGQIYQINPDHIQRGTMRTLAAVKKVCKIINSN